MLPSPIPYSESESVSLRRCLFLLASCFLIAFSSLSIFLHNCAKDCFVGLDFFSRISWSLRSRISCFRSSHTYDNLAYCAWYMRPMFLAEVAMLLGSSFLWNFVSRLCTRSLVSFLVFCRSFLSGLCVGSFLGTYALNSLKALKKQMHIHGIQSFLMKIELILPRMWGHPKNVTG